MIGGLLYLTASRLDIAFATFVCAHYQARPTGKTPQRDEDHAGCNDDSKAHLVEYNFWEIRYVVIVYVIVIALVCENEWFNVGLIVKPSYWPSEESKALNKGLEVGSKD
ncbi:hypothetical protein Tco_0126483 [Tanacetum coccineum]